MTGFAPESGMQSGVGIRFCCKRGRPVRRGCGMSCRIALWLCACLASSLLVAGTAGADAGEERLLISAPAGYVVADQQQNGPQLITQLLPSDQSLDDWRDKLAIQVFAQKPVKTPAAFRQALVAHWRDRCPGARFAPISDGHENGYAFAVWMLACNHGAATGGREFAWFKAIQGRDAFYLVQRLFAYAPARHTVSRWMRYLHAIRVCDSRVPERACPLPSH